MTAGSSFEFRTANRIVFGAGRSAELPHLISGWGGKALVCTGSRPERHGDLIHALPMPSAAFRVLGEPTVEMTRSAVEAARSQDADVVVAIGGGSALDLGKAVAMLLGNGGDPLDYLEVIGQGRPITRPSVNAIAAGPSHASVRHSWNA